MKVYLVVKKEIVYGYHGEDTFEEATPVKAYTSKEKAEEKAKEFNNVNKEEEDKYEYRRAYHPWMVVKELNIED